MNAEGAINFLKYLLEKAEYQIKSFEQICPDAKSHFRKDKESCEIAIEAIKFKSYFDSLYGQGLEIANWHQNGNLEPFDNFYESALENSIE